MARDADGTLVALRRWCVGAMVATAGIFAVTLLLAGLNHDEGWYLYAARQVLRGQWPHLDFFFPQGVLHPLVYAAFGWLWSPLGILGGRLFSALLTFTALCLAGEAVMRCCRREVDAWMARLLLWSFLGFNVWFVTFTAIPKAYALCLLAIAAMLRVLAGVQPRRGLGWGSAILAGCLGGMLPGVRLSMGILLPVIGLWLFWRRNWAGERTWLWFGVGGLAGLAVILVPELVLCPKAFLEAQTFHAARAEFGFFGVPGCLARFLRYNPLLALIGLLLAFLWRTGKPALRSFGEGSPNVQLWLCCAGALGLVHLAAPVPYDDYQIPTLLPLAMAVAAGYCAMPFDTFRIAFAKVVAVVALGVTVAGSPLVEGWISLGQDRLWMVLKEEPDLFRLRRAAKLVRTEIDRHRLPNQLLTQDLYLAVEAGVEVPPGYEMGPFMPPPCEGWLPQPLPAIAAWSGYTFALQFPAVTPTPAPQRQALLKQWQAAFPQTLAVIPRFGQQHTELTLSMRPLEPTADSPSVAERVPCPFHLCSEAAAPTPRETP